MTKSQGNQPEMLLRKEVADLLRVSAVTLARWAMNGEGPEYVRANGGRCLYPRDKLDQWLAEQGR